ncbi:MAG: DUF1838 domain-containing protein [Steroidobacteraceae bacterium]|jgi:hypothetical protein|nr:DUF1838 domain-containing protein [Steroidobacteraceae bacterium]
MDPKPLIARSASRVAELADPLRNYYSDLKIFGSLDGAPTCVTTFSRVSCLVPGREPIDLYATGNLYLFRVDRPGPGQLREPDEHAFRITSRETGFILDPTTFEPLEGLENPVTGQWQETAGIVFEDEWIYTPSGGYSAARPDYFYDKRPDALTRARPHYVLGDDLVTLREAIFHDQGPHQPRGNTLLWRARLAEVLDTGRAAVEASYDWHGTAFAWERAWLGFPTGHPARLVFHAMGRKVLSLERAAPLVTRLVRRYFPERLEV